MAASGTFKRNARQARNVIVEDSFSNGVYVSDTPIAIGYSRALVNYRVDFNTKRLVNRPGLNEITDDPYTFPLKNVNENCFISDSHILSLDDTDNLKTVTSFVNIDTDNYVIEPGYLGYDSKVVNIDVDSTIQYLIEDVNENSIILTPSKENTQAFIKDSYRAKVLLGPDTGLNLHSSIKDAFAPIPRFIETVIQNKYVSIAQHKANTLASYIVNDSKTLGTLQSTVWDRETIDLDSYYKGDVLARTSDRVYIAADNFNAKAFNVSTNDIDNSFVLASTGTENNIKFRCYTANTGALAGYALSVDPANTGVGTSLSYTEQGYGYTRTFTIDCHLTFDRPEFGSHPFIFVKPYDMRFLNPDDILNDPDDGYHYLGFSIIVDKEYSGAFDYPYNPMLTVTVSHPSLKDPTKPATKTFDLGDSPTNKDIYKRNRSIYNDTLYEFAYILEYEPNVNIFLREAEKYFESSGNEDNRNYTSVSSYYVNAKNVLPNLLTTLNTNLDTYDYQYLIPFKEYSSAKHTVRITDDRYWLQESNIVFSGAYTDLTYINDENVTAFQNIINNFGSELGFYETNSTTTIQKSNNKEGIICKANVLGNTSIMCISNSIDNSAMVLSNVDDFETIVNTVTIENTVYFYSCVIPKNAYDILSINNITVTGVEEYTGTNYETIAKSFINAFNMLGNNLSSCIYRIEYDKDDKCFNKKLYTPYTPTPTVAVNTGYNMLLNEPYTFNNSQGTAFNILGCLFYKEGSVKLQLTPGENITGVIYYSYQLNKKYKFKIQYRTEQIETYIAIATIDVIPDTKVSFDFVVPNEPFYIFIEVTEVETDNNKVILETELPYNVSNSNTSYLDSPPNYDLGTAQGMLSWKNRLYLWGVTNAPNIIFASDVLYPVEYFPYPNNIIEYDEPVMHVIEFLDKLLVFTESHIYQTSLESDGVTWTTKTVAGNIHFTPSDIYSITPIKNMLFYKSGNYYFMLVPSTSYVSLGELKIARISEPINNMLDNFYEELWYILTTLYPDLTFTSYTPTTYSVFVDGDIIKINYGFKTDNNINFIFVLNYDTLNRIWYYDILNMPSFGTLRQYRRSLLGESYYSYIEPDVINSSYFRLHLLKYNNNTKDFFIAGLKPRQFYDSGYKDINPEWKKRFREVQFKVSQPDSKRLYFKPNFILDEENRLQNNNYVLQLIEGGDYIYAPSEEYIAYGKATLEPSDEEYFLELGGENFDSHKFNLLRCKVSGKGYYPRFQIVGNNQIPYEIHNVNWVFRNMNLR